MSFCLSSRGILVKRDLPVTYSAWSADLICISLCTVLYAKAAWRQINSHFSCDLSSRISLNHLRNIELFKKFIVANRFTFPHLFYINCQWVKSSIKWKEGRPNHRSSSRRMEDDLNKSTFHAGGAAGRPPHDYPHTAAADPCVPPMGNEPIGRLSLHGPKPATRLAMGLQPFCPWSAGAGRVAPTGSRPRRGMLLSSSTRLRAHSTTGHTPTCGVPPLP